MQYKHEKQFVGTKESDGKRKSNITTRIYCYP